jgi:hypothetical protein
MKVPVREKNVKEEEGTRQREGYWKLKRAQDRRVKLRSGCSREINRRGTWKRARKSRSLDKQE